MTSSDDVQLVASRDEDAHIIKNLWPLYQHDVSRFDGTIPNRHGLFGVDDNMKTLAEHGATLDPWWGDPEALFPYLIRQGERPAGFNLIAARPRLGEGIDADFVVHEFFVLHAYRRKGVAERAAIHGFDRHRGTWEVVTYPTHRRGIAFWRRVLEHYRPGGFSEREKDHPWGRKIVFQFDNAERS